MQSSPPHGVKPLELSNLGRPDSPPSTPSPTTGGVYFSSHAASASGSSFASDLHQPPSTPTGTDAAQSVVSQAASYSSNGAWASGMCPLRTVWFLPLFFALPGLALACCECREMEGRGGCG